MSALKGKHKRVEYRARITRNQTLETLETQVTLILHTTGMARFDYNLQQITEFIYGYVQCGLLITNVGKNTTTTATALLTMTYKLLSPPYGRAQLFSRRLLNTSTLTLRLLILNVLANY